MACEQALDCKGGVVHIPVLPAQVANATDFPLRDSPHMALDQIRVAITHIVNHIIR